MSTAGIVVELVTAAIVIGILATLGRDWGSPSWHAADISLSPRRESEFERYFEWWGRGLTGRGVLAVITLVPLGIGLVVDGWTHGALDDTLEGFGCLVAVPLVVAGPWFVVKETRRRRNDHSDLPWNAPPPPPLPPIQIQWPFRRRPPSRHRAEESGSQSPPPGQLSD